MTKRRDRSTQSPPLSVFTLIWRLLLGLWLLLSSSHSVLAGEEVTQFYTDIFGSPVVAIQQQYINGVSTGVIQWRAYREPYGQRITSQPDTEEYPLQFTAKSEDFETGLTYFGARYYNAEVGRFYAIDPAGFDPGNIHSVNRYVYANNNPYKYVDPDGQQSIELDALLRTEVALPTDIPNAFGGGSGGGGLRFSSHSSSPRHALRVRAHTDAPGKGIGAKQASKVQKKTPSGGSPALKGNSYHPDSVASRVRPSYRANPAHDKRSPLFNPRKTPEPSDAASIYQSSVRGGMGTWYGKGTNGEIYRYFSDNAGSVHFSGSVPKNQVPNEILKQLGK